MEKLPFELHPNETVIRNESGVWIQGTFKSRVGQIYLTNQRLVFVQQNPFLTALFGLLGLLLEKLFAKWLGKVLLDLPLKGLTSFEHIPFRFNKKVILFHTTQGELKIGTNTSYEEWEPVLKAALKKS